MNESMELDQSRILCDFETINRHGKEWSDDRNSINKRFSYAISLCQSNDHQQIEQGISHLQHIRSMHTETYTSCLLYLALTFYYIAEYAEARSCIEELYRLQPDSRQIKSLHAAISYRMNKQKQVKNEKDEAMLISIGTGIGLGVIAAVAGIFTMTLMKKR